MRKTWLRRRPVRRPVSRATTAPSSSSECRLPFISSSASPWRTSSTALAAAAWLCGDVDDLASSPRSMPSASGDLGDLRRRPDQDRGRSDPLAAASIAPASADASQGCATAVGIGAEAAAPLQQLLVLAGSRDVSHACLSRESRRGRPRRLSSGAEVGAPATGAASRAPRTRPGRLPRFPCTSSSSPWPSSAMASTVVSKSTRRLAGISLLAIMKPVHAFTAPNAQRSMHGTWTKPATGSQVMPR